MHNLTKQYFQSWNFFAFLAVYHHKIFQRVFILFQQKTQYWYWQHYSIKKKRFKEHKFKETMKFKTLKKVNSNLERRNMFYTYNFFIHKARITIYRFLEETEYEKSG